MATVDAVQSNGTIPKKVLKDQNAKIPEEKMAVRVYNGLVTTLEVVFLLLKMTVGWIYAIYQFFVPREPKSVNGEIILITGAGHGIGREVALRFGRLGAVIVSVDLDPAGNKTTLKMLAAEKINAHSYICDVTDRNAVISMAKKVKQEVGEVTMLVNNAGIMPCKPLEQHTEEEIRKVFDVNVISHFWLIQSFLPSMMLRNHGHIVAMSSMAGVLGLRNLIPYCATKFAVRGLMEALHEELREDAKDFSGIKLTVICPFIVDTGLCKNIKIRFNSLMGVVPVEEAADNIVDAVRREHYEVTIPSSLFYVHQYMRPLPRKLPILLKDFLDSGLEAQ